MNLSYDHCTASDRDALIAFITADMYPYNAVPRPTREEVAAWIDTGYYTETFWITLDANTHVGVVQYQDASSIHAEVHIRLQTPYRGQGIGTQAIAWLTNYLFQTYPKKHRVEGWTRADNHAMHQVFRKCGYVKEAHLRQDFPVGDGTFRDKVCYGLLRDDWQRGTATPVEWGDENDNET